MITVPANKVQLASNLLGEVKCHTSVEKLIGRPIQSCSSYSQDMVPCRYHAVIEAATMAFHQHRPLVLSPDVIWLMIAQGIARHIELNAEKLRHHFVQHKDKKVLKVRRDDFIFGSPENPWEDVFSSFSAQLKEYIGEKHGLMVSDFSTTGSVERAASEVTLMESMKSYFSYEVHTCCGIPYVRLEGTTEDWAKIEEKVNGCREFLPDWWVSTLQSICKKLIDASEGNFDEKFWTSVYSEGGGSGGPYINGWLAKLVPYVRNWRTKTYSVVNNREGMFGGITSDDLPNSVCQTEFKWMYYEDIIPMQFVAGMVGIKQNHDNLELTPTVGWAIAQNGEPTSKGN